MKIKSAYRISAFILLCILLITLTFACNLQTIISNAGRIDDSLDLWDIGPITLDPAISGEMSSHTYIMQIYSGLVYLDSELQVQPDIAQSWTTSPDGKTYIFSLKDNVKFHDGRVLTAADIKYSLERACDPLTGSATAGLYLNDIVGSADVLSAKTKEIAGIKVIDTKTLSITIDAPKAYFLAKMAYPTAFVVDKNDVESGRDWWKQPNGTGPFKLKNWIPGQQITLERNSEFYRGPAQIETINFHILSGNPTDLYELGEIDIAPVYQNYIDVAIDPKGDFSQELNMVPELGLNYIGFNVQTPPFDDINVRQAFCQSINKDKIIKIILKDTVRNAVGIIPPGMPGYNADLTGYDFNIEKARELISESKYADLSHFPAITMTVAGQGNYLQEDLAAIIQEWQNNLGIKITVRQLETDIFLYRLNEEIDEMFYMGWIADYPDPQDFLEYLLKTGSYYNAGKYSNKDVDALLQTAAVEQDAAKRMAMYQQAEQIIMQDAPLIPLTNGINHYLVKPYVKNYRINATGMPIFNEVYIEP